MPLLPAEPSCYPPALFADADAARAGRGWWVLHTKPRQEKSLARQLSLGRIPFYLPTVARHSRIRDRAFCSFLPLFPGYLFLLADAAERQRTLETRRVVRALEVPDQGQLWHDLGQIERLIASGQPIFPQDGLIPGALVEIRTGPLAGLKGKILREASGHRFVVQVDFIQRGASVLLNDYSLAALADDRAAHT
jgi:transcriptional antiterminator RfaH